MCIILICPLLILWMCFVSPSEGRICSCAGSIPSFEETVVDDVDVQEEERTVKQQVKEGIVDPSTAVQIHGLVKVYARTTKINHCKCKKTKSYHAV